MTLEGFLFKLSFQFQSEIRNLNHYAQFYIFLNHAEGLIQLSISCYKHSQKRS